MSALILPGEWWATVRLDCVGASDRPAALRTTRIQVKTISLRLTEMARGSGTFSDSGEYIWTFCKSSARSLLPIKQGPAGTANSP